MRTPVASLLLATLAALLLAGCGGGSKDGPQFKYEAVVEADTGSPRLFLYRYFDEDASRRVELTWETPLPPDPQRPLPAPLPSFESAPANAGPQGVRVLLDVLSAELSTRGIPKGQVPVSVLGLDAMRGLFYRNPTAAAQIYASVRQTVGEAGYATRYAATLSGDANGVFLWAGANDRFGNLAPNRATNGVIGIGSTGAQVTYAAAERAGVSVGIPVTVRGQAYRVYSVSYEGLGYDEARRRMITGGGSGSGTGLNNCYPSNAARAAPLAYNPGVAGLSIGAGNFVFETCSALYESVVRDSAVSRTVAVPGFESTDFLIPDALDISLLGVALAPGDLLARLNSLCEGPDAWSLRIQPRAGAGLGAQNLCADGTFLHTFLFGPNGVNAAASRTGFIRQIEGLPPRASQGFVLLGGSLTGVGSVWIQ